MCRRNRKMRYCSNDANPPTWTACTPNFALSASKSALPVSKRICPCLSWSSSLTYFIEIRLQMDPKLSRQSQLYEASIPFMRRVSRSNEGQHPLYLTDELASVGGGQRRNHLFPAARFLSARISASERSGTSGTPPVDRMVTRQSGFAASSMRTSIVLRMATTIDTEPHQ